MRAQLYGVISHIAATDNPIRQPMATTRRQPNGAILLGFKVTVDHKYEELFSDRWRKWDCLTPKYWMVFDYGDFFNCSGNAIDWRLEHS